MNATNRNLTYTRPGVYSKNSCTTRCLLTQTTEAVSVQHQKRSLVTTETNAIQAALTINPQAAAAASRSTCDLLASSTVMVAEGVAETTLQTQSMASRSQTHFTSCYDNTNTATSGAAAISLSDMNLPLLTSDEMIPHFRPRSRLMRSLSEHDCQSVGCLTQHSTLSLID